MLRTSSLPVCCLVTWLALAAASSVLAEPPAPTKKLTGRPPAGSPAYPSEYQRVMSLGLEEFERGQWVEARALFMRGHALAPNARSLRALGMTAFNLQRYPDALRELTQALSDPRRPLSASQREATRELQDRADTFVGLYHVRIDPPQAQLRVDGLLAALEADGSLLLSVGEHLLELEATGYAGLRRPLVVDGSDGETLRLSLLRLAREEPPAPGPPPRLATDTRDISAPKRALEVFRDYRFTLSFGAGALAFGASALALQVLAMKEQRALEERCERDGDCHPTDEVTTRRDRLQRSAASLFACSLLSLVGATVSVSIEREHVKKRREARRDRPRAD